MNVRWRYAIVLRVAHYLSNGIGGTSVFATIVALDDKHIGDICWAKLVSEGLQSGMLKAHFNHLSTKAA